MTGDNLSLAVDADGVATILWDVRDAPANILSEGGIAAFAAAADAVAGDAAIRGAVIASARPGFHLGAGPALVEAFFERSPDELRTLMTGAMRAFLTLEGSGKPVAAAIAGDALGAGFEMALACHARFVADEAGLRLGLPEASFGLMPGFGGIQRLVRLMDWRAAVETLVRGRTWSPREALAAGAVTALLPREGVLAAARAFVLSNPGATQPWAAEGRAAPAAAPGFEDDFAAVAAGIARSGADIHPAPRLIAETAYHGLQMPIEPALRLELRRFIELTRQPAVRSMVRTQLVAIPEARAGRRRPARVPPLAIETLGVIGGGLMGGGIAHEAARSGLEVVIVERDEAGARRGLAYSERLLDHAVARGDLSPAERAARLGRIRAGTGFDALAGCDLVIEAVFEDAAVKHDVLGRAEAVMRPGAVLATNTSTIPVGQLARGLARKDRFLGLHFFSPVERMALVEIIRGAATSEATLAAGFDLARRLGKTPVAVRDGRGFFTTRVVVGYMLEGMALLAEGVAPVLIENAGRLAGMPMGPLRLTDMVAVDLVERIEAQTEADLGPAYVANPGRPAGQALLARGRAGVKAGAGFYDYGREGPVLWPGLGALFPPAPAQPAIAEVVERLMFRQAAETLRCFDDGVLASAADADVGSVLGWGFAPHTGGVASYIDAIGAARLLAWCKAAAVTLGPRFAPARTLSDLAARGARLGA